MAKKARLGKDRRPTMMDVAAMAGVSQATVSLVLNGSRGAKLSDATRKRVHEAARELGYNLIRRGRGRCPMTGRTLFSLRTKSQLIRGWLWHSKVFGTRRTNTASTSVWQSATETKKPSR
ncbi:LacI family DNA-binding transcriptional regulator [Roseibium aggregatum]|uniref:LacI family DNA-binding transcriptional regulator n=1 Tax=Roseibium aggregatum TaxID=187304 RepID=UPI002B4B9C66|nr:LacI family DNA-binding transcriptional regulator [Roseibium aggregatum]